MRVKFLFPANVTGIEQYASNYLHNASRTQQGVVHKLYLESTKREDLINQAIKSGVVEFPDYFTSDNFPNQRVVSVLKPLGEQVIAFLRRIFPPLENETINSEKVGLTKVPFLDCGPYTVFYIRNTNYGTLGILYASVTVDPNTGRPSIIQKRPVNN